MTSRTAPPLEQVLGSAAVIDASRVEGTGPDGRLPLTAEMLRDEPSGNIFGLTQNAGMGWRTDLLAGPQYVIVSTMGGVRSEQGEPIALGYHTGHWEIGLLVRGAAESLRAAGAIPFAVYCSDPCDGRTQGTTGMFDSLAYRNDAAIVMRRLIRSLPTASGVLGIATCDKGLPATMLALAGSKELPGVIVPGGVTLPARDAEDAGQVQSLGARFTHDLISLDYAATMGCRACGSSGGGCQFLGTAATSQVVAEALGMALPHSALAPSGEPVWLELASRSATALQRLHAMGVSMGQILTPAAVENAMLVHAAFGGSTNLLLHIPAIAAAAGLNTPTVDDWIRINRATSRVVDALPNGPRGFATAQVFMAGGVPEVMLHLRRMGLLNGRVLTATGDTLDATLDWWESSERRRTARARLASAAAIDPDHIIMSPDAARRAGLTSTIVFPRGNLAPQGSVIKATAIDASVIDADGVYRHRGPARVFTDEREAIRAVKGTSTKQVREGDVIVLIGMGPSGTGMQETAQITTALRYLPWGRHVALITDGRFSGFSSGACIGHVGPEALDEGPIGRVRDDDIIEIVIDRNTLTGAVNLVGAEGMALDADACETLLRARPPHPGLAPHERLPNDSRLWAALQRASGGTWAGCVYNVERIVAALEARRHDGTADESILPKRAREGSLPTRQVREMPEPPRNYWRLVGPGIVAGGVGLSSGEFVLWPFIASQVGLVLLWGALIGVVTQFFLNMEVERYTLATGETALTGFNRFWRHWGLVFAVLGYLGNLWPGWAISSATLTSYLFGGNPTIIAVVSLVVIGVSLTFAPVVYVALERLIFVKVATVLVLVVLGIAFAIEPAAWRALPAGFASIGTLPSGLSVALVFGAFAFAGAGGAQNLCQSNWIRDKGFGMGQYVPRLVSPLTSVREKSHSTATSYIFEPTPANLARWKSWWRFANVEQMFSFVLVTVVTITLTSLLAYSTLFGQANLPNDVSFLRLEAQQLQRTVAPWFGVLFLAVGAFSLFGTAMGVVDYTSRLAADILKSTYIPDASESRTYFWLVWGMVSLGCTILLAGISQPLTLLVISASTAGSMMFLYSFMLIALNRQMLPPAIRIGPFRIATLVWSTLLFGSLAVLTIYTQAQTLRR